MDAAAGEARSGKLNNFSEDELIGDMNGSLGESEVEVRIICIHIRCDSFLSILFFFCTDSKYKKKTQGASVRGSRRELP